MSSDGDRNITDHYKLFLVSCPTYPQDLMNENMFIHLSVMLRTDRQTDEQKKMKYET